MNQRQKVNLLIIVLLIFLLLVTVLIFIRFVIGAKILTEGRQKSEAIFEMLTQEEAPRLNYPAFKTTDPVKGSESAVDTIFVFSSFTCSYCRDQAAVLDQLLEQNPKVSVIWKDLFSSLDEPARQAALAARCAQAQNKFWPFHDYLYANQDGLDSQAYTTIAQTLELDLTKYNQCLANREFEPLIDSDLAEATGLGIDGAPYLFVNGQRVSGALELKELAAMFKDN